MEQHDYKQLELNIISAQDLGKCCSFRKMKTYAVAWIHGNRKLSTQIDRTGGSNPTWNDKVIFRVEDRFLRAETSALMIEIYCVGYVKDTLAGTVRVLLSNLLKGYGSEGFSGMNFIALQVRRPSGRPQGIMNIGTVILDDNLHNISVVKKNIGAMGYQDLMGKNLHNLQRARPRCSPTNGPIACKQIPRSADKPTIPRQHKNLQDHHDPKEVNIKDACNRTKPKINGPTSDRSVYHEKPKGERLVNGPIPVLKAERISSGCYRPCFIFRLNLRKNTRDKVGSRNGRAKIHLSPSDNSISEKFNGSIPSADKSSALTLELKS